MVPFIVKYARIHNDRENGLGHVDLEYDTQHECTVLAGSSDLAINVKQVLAETSGSRITRAQTDPTSDEQTDR